MFSHYYNAICLNQIGLLKPNQIPRAEIGTAVVTQLFSSSHPSLREGRWGDYVTSLGSNVPVIPLADSRGPQKSSSIQSPSLWRGSIQVDENLPSRLTNSVPAYLPTYLGFFCLTSRSLPNPKFGQSSAASLDHLRWWKPWCRRVSSNLERSVRWNPPQ